MKIQNYSKRATWTVVLAIALVGCSDEEKILKVKSQVAEFSGKAAKDNAEASEVAQKLEIVNSEISQALEQLAANKAVLETKQAELGDLRGMLQK